MGKQLVWLCIAPPLKFTDCKFLLLCFVCLFVFVLWVFEGPLAFSFFFQLWSTVPVLYWTFTQIWSWYLLFHNIWHKTKWVHFYKTSVSLHFLCVVGSKAQWTEQHARALQAEVTHSTLRRRWWPLPVLQCPHPWAGVLSHPQTRETNQEETVNRHASGKWKRMQHIMVFTSHASFSSQRLSRAPFSHHGEEKKEQRMGWISGLTVVWNQPDTGWWRNFLLLQMSYFCNLPSFLFKTLMSELRNNIVAQCICTQKSWMWCC